jgi:2-oxoglutarate ferredoxin oxidoreductase subunit delta
MAFGKHKRAYGKVTINPNWCKGCGFCVNFCPTDALEMSTAYNAKGYHPPKVKSSEDCRDCKFCEKVCPEFAIYVTTDETKGV